MNIFRPRDFFSHSKECVSNASYCPKKLTLIHTGVIAGATLLAALLSYLLGLSAGETSGLTGISSRAALETAQVILELSTVVLGPFWALGFIRVAMELARKESPTPGTLLTGFHRWGAALRMMLLQGVIYFIAMFICMQAGSFLYALSPFSAPMNELAQQMLTADAMDTEAMTQMLMNLEPDALMNLFWSMVPFLFLPALVVMILLSYRMRLASYILMDDPRCGAIYAIVQSFRLSKGHCLKLAWMDLSFWWFYVLEALVQVLCFGDLLLPLLGIELGMNPNLAALLFYAVSLMCQMALYMWQKPQIVTSYALFYDSLLAQNEQAEV